MNEGGWVIVGGCDSKFVYSLIYSSILLTLHLPINSVKSNPPISREKEVEVRDACERQRSTMSSANMASFLPAIQRLNQRWVL